MKRVLGAAAAAAVFAGAGSVWADEVYVGAFAHDVTAGISERGVERGQDIEGGYRTAPFTWLSAIGRPRVYFDYLGNDAGRTSFGAIGFVWRRDIVGRLYGQIGVGGALHDQNTVRLDPEAPGISPTQMQNRLFAEHNFKAMGSRFLFNPNLSLGVHLSPRVAVEAVWNHYSNAGLGKVNPGLDDFGGRLVFRFGPRTR